MPTSAWGEIATAALDAGDWAAARAAFERDLSEGTSAAALEGLARSLWWLKEPQAALDVTAAAYRALLAEGLRARAFAAAVWLARQHHALHRDGAVAAGWLGRARRLAVPDDACSAGWVALTESELGPEVLASLELARQALALARSGGDADLEILALARTGLLEVSVGEVDAGTARVNEAMAAATGGEAGDPRYVGEAFCALLEVATLLGDRTALQEWATAAADFHATYEPLYLGAYGTVTTTDILSVFCGSCCGAAYVVTGRLEEAEQELVASIEQLTRASLHARCVHPVAQLAELRMAQGRLDEAEELLCDYQDLPECTRALAALDLARARPEVAMDRLRTALATRAGEIVRSLPLWSLAVDAGVALGDVDATRTAATQVAAVAAATGSRSHQAEALAARGKAAALVGDPAASDLLRGAAVAFGEAAMPLAACRARLARASAIVSTEPGVAVAEARASLVAFERMGARSDADQAASVLRGLGVSGRTGPRDGGVLSRRESEVLALLAQGLTNAEIAGRLFISPKTAGHHVSSILTKLGLRSRTEAAAYAVARAAGAGSPAPE